MHQLDKFIDGGLKSRKLLLTVLAMVLIFVGADLTIHWQSLQAVYSTMTGGIIGALGLYLGGNVGAKLMATKADSSDPHQGH